jgi:putative aminopeptidase FrvX
MELLSSLYLINNKSGSEAEIKTFILQQLLGLDLVVETDDYGNIFITKGITDSYPCVTAHLDEIHQPVKRKIVIDNGVVRAVDYNGESVGCGADDKNGLWIAIRLLHSTAILKVALFVEEEKDGEIAGCRGSRACSMSFFDNVKYILAVDRKGNSDVVIYSKKSDVKLCDEGFIPSNLLEKYGYKCVSGGRTDVVALKERGLQLSCCNISCGYYNAHKNDEYTVFSELENSLSFVSELIDSL